jgi:AraC-like DNA-binding protein
MAENLQRVGMLILVPTILRQFAVEPAVVLAMVGLPADALDHPDNNIPYFKMGRLLDTCVQHTGCQHFGLLVGQRASTSSLGVIGELMSHAPNLGTAIRDLVNHQHRHARGAVVYLLELGDDMLFGYAVYESDVEGATQLYDGAVAMAVGIIRRALGVSDVDGLEVVLARQKPAHVDPYTRWFGVNTRFNSDCSGVVFPRSWMARQVVGASTARRRELEVAIGAYWQAGDLDFAGRLRRAISVGLLTNTTSNVEMAAKLGLSSRTLQRRLDELGTSFQQVLDETRFESAKQFLRNTTLTISHIGFVLGFADQSAFTRSFTRWSGLTPGEWQRTALFERSPKRRTLHTDLRTDLGADLARS